MFRRVLLRLGGAGHGEHQQAEEQRRDDVREPVARRVVGAGVHGVGPSEGGHETADRELVGSAVSPASSVGSGTPSSAKIAR